MVLGANLGGASPEEGDYPLYLLRKFLLAS